MATNKRWEPRPDRNGVTLRDKLVILGYVDPQGPIEYDAVMHDALDVMLADRAIRVPTLPIRT